MGNYAGADWLARNLQAGKKPAASPLGNAVADLLGDVARGLYHVDARAIERADWSDPYCIEISMADGSRFATWDFDYLTGLVVLAHERCIRVTIGAATFRYIKLQFHQRQRTGGMSERHPTIEDAVARWRKVRDWEPLFLILCTEQRGHGDEALWWKPERSGYTTDLDTAGRYTADQASACAGRDVAVPIDDVLKHRVWREVDAEHFDAYYAKGAGRLSELARARECARAAKAGASNG